MVHIPVYLQIDDHLQMHWLNLEIPLAVFDVTFWPEYQMFGR